MVGTIFGEKQILGIRMAKVYGLRVERSAARSANRSVKRAGVDHLTAARQPPAAQHRGLVAQCGRSEIASETPSETPSGLSGAKSEGFVSPFIQCLQNEGCCVSIGKYHINQLSPARVEADLGLFSHRGGGWVTTC